MRRRAAAVLAATLLAGPAAAGPCGTDGAWRAAGRIAAFAPVLDAGLRARESLLSLSAVALAGQLRAEAETARRWGLSETPAFVREDLGDRVPAPVLDAVRWRAGPGGSVLLRLLFGPGDAIAVTLGETVVFRDTGEAADPALWAHELEHVAQYRRLGAMGFARAYVRCPGVMEAEARAAARRATE